MVRGKPSNRLDRGVDILTLSLRDRFLNVIVDQHCDFEGQGWTLEPCSRGGVFLSTSRKERQTVVWERPDGVPNVCVRSAWPG